MPGRHRNRCEARLAPARRSLGAKYMHAQTITQLCWLVSGQAPYCMYEPYNTQAAKSGFMSCTQHSKLTDLQDGGSSGQVGAAAAAHVSLTTAHTVRSQQQLLLHRRMPFFVRQLSQHDSGASQGCSSTHAVGRRRKGAMPGIAGDPNDAMACATLLTTLPALIQGIQQCSQQCQQYCASQCWLHSGLAALCGVRNMHQQLLGCTLMLATTFR